MRPSWTGFFPRFYRLLRLGDPLIAAWWRRFGVGNTIGLEVVGRRSGRPRRLFLGLLHVESVFYLGHPNGATGWTRNLEAAGTGEISFPGAAPRTVRAVRLAPGPERDRVIRSTWRQHPFPGNVIYWLARRHVAAVGVYYRLEPVDPPGPAGPVDPPGPVDPAAPVDPVAPP